MNEENKENKPLEFEFDPADKNLLNIMKPFIGTDDLRPIMSSINFDKNGAISTDTHRLMFLKGKSDVPLEVHVAVGNNWGELK